VCFWAKPKITQSHSRLHIFESCQFLFLKKYRQISPVILDAILKIALRFFASFPDAQIFTYASGWRSCQSFGQVNLRQSLSCNFTLQERYLQQKKPPKKVAFMILYYLSYIRTCNQPQKKNLFPYLRLSQLNDRCTLR